MNPRDAYLCMDRAWTYSMLRQFGATAEMIARALEISPHDPEVLVSKVELLHTTGDLPAARAVLERIPSGAADGQAEEMRYTEALWERHYDEALRVAQVRLAQRQANSPSDGSSYYVLIGDAHTLAGDKDKARQSYLAAKAALEPLQEKEPESPFLASTLAFAEAGLGNKEAALRQAERAVSLLPAAKDPVFGPGMEELLAGVEAQVGETERAIQRIRRLLTTPYGAFPITQAKLRLDPTWDPLRADPRFKILAEGPEPRTIYH